MFVQRKIRGFQAIEDSLRKRSFAQRPC